MTMRCVRGAGLAAMACVLGAVPAMASGSAPQVTQGESRFDQHFLLADEYLISKREYRSGQGWERIYLAKMVTPPTDASKGEAEFFIIAGGNKGTRLWTRYFARTRPVTVADLRLGSIYYALDSVTGENGVYAGPRHRDDNLRHDYFVGTLTDDSETYKGWIQLSGYRVKPTALRMAIPEGATLPPPPPPVQAPPQAQPPQPPPPPAVEVPVARPALPPPLPVDLTASQKQTFRQFLKRLKGVPSAWLEGRPSLQKDRLLLVKKDWERVSTVILPLLTPLEKEVLGIQLDGMTRQAGLPGARFALDAYGLLANKLPVSWDRNLRWADRDVMDGWVTAEEGDWQNMPNLAGTFVEVLKQGEAEHLKLIPLLREHLQKYQGAVRARDKAAVQLECSLLRRLLEELDVM